MESQSDRKELKAKWKNDADDKTYNKDEVSKHNSKQDCWIVIHGQGNENMWFGCYSELMSGSLQCDRIS